MKKIILKWIKKNTTIVKATGTVMFLVAYSAFINGIQRDLDEVHYSKEIIRIEKENIKEIKEYKRRIEEQLQKIDELRKENMSLRQDQLKLMEEIISHSPKNTIEMEVNDENK